MGDVAFALNRVRSTMRDGTYVVGDVHGETEKLHRLLTESGLVDTHDRWAGGESTLIFVGDLFDRGPSGIGVLDLAMRLEFEAAADGGMVETVLGNHEVQLLAAHLLPEARSTGPGRTFMLDWERNGGRRGDIEALQPVHVEWLLRRPAMIHAAGRLVIHADATLYERYGRSVEEVNDGMRAVLSGHDVDAWDRMLADFSQRRAFTSEETARRFLDLYGGIQIVHGHSPIAGVRGLSPREVNGPLLYAGGLAVNVDGGMYLGGPGFLYELPSFVTLAESESGTSAMV